MTRSPRFRTFLVLFLLALPGSASSLFAQGNIQYQVANLMEDVRLLDERLRQMSVQLEDMRRENARLRQAVDEYERRADGQMSKFVTSGQLDQSIRSAVSALEARDEAMKERIIETVQTKMTELAKGIQKAMPTTAAPTKPKTVKTHFPKDDIPTSGIAYEVKPGDTLSRIASRNASRTDWIQNINEIADPSLLQVGQTIFVPQAAE